MLKIGAVWKRTKEDGTVYLSGRIDSPVPIIIDETTQILLFKNKSEHEKSPAFDVLISKSKPKPQAIQQDLLSDEGAQQEEEIPF